LLKRQTLFFTLLLLLLPLPIAQARAELKAPPSQPGCQIADLPAEAQDPLRRLLGAQAHCPQDVHAFRELLHRAGGQVQTTLVANRGFHNPRGSFSLFELYTGPLAGQQVQPGEFFFGHFTEARGQVLQHQQTPSQGALMIELIIWDSPAQLFRFYEMVGDGQQGRWFYRGDSLDIQADLHNLHLQANPQQPVFGHRLRCSACHLGGGPIMKELVPPHNDWWTQQRPLPLAQQPDSLLQANLSSLSEASELSRQVQLGMQKLSASPRFQAARQAQSWPQQLRPLFCAEEVNLVSDFQPLEPSADTHLPLAALVDPRLLGSETQPLQVPGAAYQAALQALDARFPETDRLDGDHAWLAPVKAQADIQAIDKLVSQGLLEAETVFDVLAVDLLRPVVSPQRCGLLRTVPAQWSPDWQKRWLLNLASSSLPGAETLYQNLTQAQRQRSYHQQQAANLIASCRQGLAQGQSVTPLLNWLGQQRQAVYTSEIARHPRGQIFEPGFRILFPALQLSTAELGLNCQEL